MLFTRRVLDGIADGMISVAFRRWRRPTVRAGGTLVTAVGVLAIDRLTSIDLTAITEGDARRAGYASRADLVGELNARPDGDVYRIDFHLAGADPRIALRANAALSTAERDALRQRLERLDRAADRPWTARVLRLIADRPAVRAGDLAPAVGQDLPTFKRNVRKLKAMGLTESLEVGYRLSPRGRALLG